jgi:hypothetical protein
MISEKYVDILADTVRSLETVPERVSLLYRGLPAGYWDWKPGSWEACPGEEFSFREHACHMLDFDALVYHPRIQRVRDEQHPKIERVFGYELAKERRYADIDPLEAVAGFVAARRTTVATIKALDAGQLRRTAELAQYGTITLAGIIHLLFDHDSRHMACMHWLLAKLACSDSGIQPATPK